MTKPKVEIQRYDCHQNDGCAIPKSNEHGEYVTYADCIDAIREAKADAWREGYELGFTEGKHGCQWPSVFDNPYKEMKDE